MHEYQQRYSGLAERYDKTKARLDELTVELSNGVKAVLSGMNFPELEEEMTSIRLRIAELEQIISTSTGRPVTREEIIAQLKEDAGNIDTTDMKRLVKAYVTKIYATDNEIIVSGGVNKRYSGERV